MKTILMQCPHCKAPREVEVKHAANIQCGNCLMERTDIVQLVPVSVDVLKTKKSKSTSARKR